MNGEGKGKGERGEEANVLCGRYPFFLAAAFAGSFEGWTIVLFDFEEGGHVGWLVGGVG